MGDKLFEVFWDVAERGEGPSTDNLRVAFRVPHIWDEDARKPNFFYIYFLYILFFPLLLDSLSCSSHIPNSRRRSQPANLSPSLPPSFSLHKSI